MSSLMDIRLPGDKEPLKRSELYGDGFFETFIVYKGEWLFFSYHAERIIATITFLRLKLSVPLKQVKESVLNAASSLDQDCVRVRIDFVRSDGGKYTPQNNEAVLTISLEPVKMKHLVSDQSRKVDVGSTLLPTGEFGNYKTIGKHMQVIAALEAKDRGLDDLVLLNADGRLCETISGNLFLVRGNEVYTPSLSSGCLNGVIRKVLLTELDNVRTLNLTLSDLKNADALFATNSVYGVIPLSYKGSSENEQSKQIRDWLSQRRFS